MDRSPSWRYLRWRFLSLGRTHPWHARLALVLIGLGITAIASRNLGIWPPVQMVSAPCLSFEASVPRDWKVTPSSDACGSIEFSIRQPENQVVLVIQNEGPNALPVFSQLYGYVRTSRSGTRYTEIAESNRNLTVVVVANGHVISVRCTRGSESACRPTMTVLLDGSHFVQG